MSPRNIAAWILGSLLGLFFIYSGFLKVIPSDMMVSRFAAWGYPRWFVSITGLLEMLGGLLALLPITATYGAGIIMAVMLGATYTHLSSGIGSPAFALIILVLAAVVAWLRYPRAAGLGKE